MAGLAETEKVQVTFEKKDYLDLSEVAEEEHRTLASQVRHLTLKALKIRKAQQTQRAEAS